MAPARQRHSAERAAAASRNEKTNPAGGSFFSFREATGGAGLLPRRAVSLSGQPFFMPERKVRVRSSRGFSTNS